MNSICNNVLKEQYRSSGHDASLDNHDDEGEKDFPATGISVLDMLAAKQTDVEVREIVDKLPERDRRLLREVYLEERDKDEVCRDFGVDREYLRVLLHRAKQAFKSRYVKNMGNGSPGIF